ncbi:hypothetical protein J4421_00990 [Candidatus Woesearchaeota archaeon]|nr:hypothetical protein [Candidatus Woesearchaeota archaeon]
MIILSFFAVPWKSNVDIFCGSVENLEKVALAVTFVPLSYLILSGGAYQLVLRIAVLRLLIGLGGDFFYRAIFCNRYK